MSPFPDKKLPGSPSRPRPAMGEDWEQEAGCRYRCVAAVGSRVACWVLLAVLVLAGRAWAAPIAITIEPDRLPAEEGLEAVITIDVDVPTTATSVGSNDPSFTIQVAGSRGLELMKGLRFDKHRSSSGVKDKGPGFFEVTRDPKAKLQAARGRAVYVLTIPEGTKPGELQFLVQGSQGVRILGVVDSGHAMFRAAQSLVLTPVDGTIPGGPARRPPFAPTPNAVNPPAGMLRRAGELAVLLLLAATTSHLVSRRRTVRQPKEVAEPKAAGSPSEPPPLPGRPKDVLVCLTANPPKVNGDGRTWTRLVLYTECPPGATMDILSVEYESNNKSFVPQRMEGPVDWLTPLEELGPGELPWRGPKDRYNALVRGPWQWGDVEDLEFTVTVTYHLKTGAGGKLVPLVKKANCRTVVVGAKPYFDVKLGNPEKVHANGRDGAEISATFSLFEEVTETEEIEIRANGYLNGEPFARVDKCEKASTRRLQRVRWVPPFLVGSHRVSTKAGPGGLVPEEVDLEISCDWVDGEMLQQAPSLGFPEPQKIVRTVKLLGCSLKHKADPEWFTPLSKGPIRLSAKLLDAADRAVPKLFDKDVHRFKGAAVSLWLGDRSQGRPGVVNGVPMPPQPLPVPKAPDYRRADQVGVTVGDGGRIVLSKPAEKDAAAQGDSIELKRKEPQADLVNIHGGPVEYFLVLEDGLGGRVEYSGAAHLALDSLVLETGGPDFRFYENRPSLLQVHLEPFDRSVRLPAGEFTLCAQFAVVDEQGVPVADAGQVRQDVECRRNEPIGNLLMGHTPRTHHFCIQPSDGVVRYTEKSHTHKTPQGWFEPTDKQIKDAMVLRTRWHDLRETEFGQRESGTPLSAAKVAKAAEEITWRKMRLELAVRLELLDRSTGALLAVSDRRLGKMRTPPESAYENHRFKFVFRLPVVYVPGVLGSQLNAKVTEGGRTEDRCLWPPGGQEPLDSAGLKKWIEAKMTGYDAMKRHQRNGILLSLTRDGKARTAPPVEAVDLIFDGIGGEVEHPFIKQFMAEMGYWEIDPALQDNFEGQPTLQAEKDRSDHRPKGTGEHLGLTLMPYDWRQDNRVHGDELQDRIERLIGNYYPDLPEFDSRHRKALILCHSMGGLVCWHFGNTRPRFWEDHVAAMVMMATPAMGAAAPMYRHFTGFWEGGSVADITHNFLLNQADMVTLRNSESVYQLMGPYKPYVHVQDPKSPALRGEQVEQALAKPAHELYAKAVGEGSLLLNTLRDRSDRCWLREHSPIGPYLGMDRNRKPSLWYQDGFVKKGLKFHEEKKDSAPPRSVMIYGEGRPTSDKVLLKLECLSVGSRKLGLYRPEYDLSPGLRWNGKLLEECEIRDNPWLEIFQLIKEQVEWIYGLEPHFPSALYPPVEVEVGGPTPVPYQSSVAGPMSIRSIDIPDPHSPDPGTEARARKFVEALHLYGVPAKLGNSLLARGSRLAVSFPIKDISALVFIVTDIKTETNGDGTVPCWSMETRGLPESLPSYKVRLSDESENAADALKTHGQMARSDIVHSTIASDPKVQHLLRSILTGTMPDPDNAGKLKSGAKWWPPPKP